MLEEHLLIGSSTTALSERKKGIEDGRDSFSYVKATNASKHLIKPPPLKILENTFVIFNSHGITYGIIRLLLTSVLNNTRLKVSQELKKTTVLLW